MVELEGLEPSTFPNAIGTVSQISYECGAGGTRTLYLFNAIEALSQMSYSPTQYGPGP